MIQPAVWTIMRPLPATLLLSAAELGCASPAPPVPRYLQQFRRNIRVGHMHRVGTMALIHHPQVVLTREMSATVGVITRAIGQTASKWPIVSPISFFSWPIHPHVVLDTALCDSAHRKINESGGFVKPDVNRSDRSTTWFLLFAACEFTWLAALDLFRMRVTGN